MTLASLLEAVRIIGVVHHLQEQEIVLVWKQLYSSADEPVLIWFRSFQILVCFQSLSSAGLLYLKLTGYTNCTETWGSY